MAINSRPTNQSAEYNILYEIYRKIDRLLGISSSPPAGGATAANQVTGNASLASIDNKQTTTNNSLAEIASFDTLITGQGGQTASGQNIVLAVAGTGGQDISGHKSIAIQIIPTGTVSSGVVTFEGSNDGVTYVAIPLYDEASLTINPISTVSPATGVNRFFLGPVHWRFFRARISTVIGGGGSLQAITMLNRESFTPDIFTITQTSAANLNATVVGTLTAVTPGTAAAQLGKAEDAIAASGDTGVFALGVRRDGPTLASQAAAGDYHELAVGSGGELYVRNRPMSYSRVVADGQVKGSAGHIHTINIAPTGSVTAGVLTIYDSLTETGTVIYSVALPTTTFTPFTVLLNVAAATGIFVGFDATLANVQVTTSYI